MFFLFNIPLEFFNHNISRKAKRERGRGLSLKDYLRNED